MTIKESTSALGATHANTLNAQNNLAVVLWRKGKQSESLRLQREVVRSMEESLSGTDAVATRVARDNLATSLRQLGLNAEAEALQSQNLEAAKSERRPPVHMMPPDILQLRWWRPGGWRARARARSDSSDSDEE